LIFLHCESIYDYQKGGTIVEGSNVQLDWQDYYYDDEEDLLALEQRKQRKVAWVSIRRKGTKHLHYAV
jgi:hypothetical protein